MTERTTPIEKLSIDSGEESDKKFSVVDKAKAVKTRVKTAAREIGNFFSRLREEHPQELTAESDEMDSLYNELFDLPVPFQETPSQTPSPGKFKALINRRVISRENRKKRNSRSADVEPTSDGSETRFEQHDLEKFQTPDSPYTELQGSSTTEAETVSTTESKPLRRTLESVYDAEEIAAIHTAALALKNTPKDLRQENPSYQGESDSQGTHMNCFKFMVDEKQFVALTPKYTKDAFSLRASVLEKLRSEPTPKSLEFPIVIDKENKLIVTEHAKGKLAGELSPDEIQAIPDDHLREVIDAVEFLTSKGLVIDSKPEHFFYDPNEGFTIIDTPSVDEVTSRPLTSEEECMLFITGITIAGSEQQNVASWQARHELDQRCQRLARNHWRANS